MDSIVLASFTFAEAGFAAVVSSFYDDILQFFPESEESKVFHTVSLNICPNLTRG